MKKIIILALTQLISFCCIANIKLINYTDTTYNLTFYKLSPAKQKTDSVLFQFRYNETGDTILAACFINPLWFIAGTQTSDYVTFKTKENEFVYFNSERFKLNKTDTIIIYILKFNIPKHEFKKIFSGKIPQLKINFAPNPDAESVIKDFFKGQKISVYGQYSIDLSKRNLKAKISKPNKVQLEKIRAWIN
jgi:hypothetical protein